MLARVLVVVAFVAVLALPFAVRWSVGPTVAAAGDDSKARRVLVVATPHVEQIREEFARAFSRWHERHYGEPARIDWRTPGGTSEIIKLLEAQFAAAAEAGRVDEHGVFEPGVTGFDVLMGGGSYEHGKLKDRRTAGGRTYRLSVPAGFSEDELRAWFAPPLAADAREKPTLEQINRIGVQHLFDPEQYWIGTALSSFGIVYNREVVAALGMQPPTSFTDLTDPRYRGMLALADPRQSGSVTTTYESILNDEGWKGWKTLRAMCANARYFASSSTRPPIDVSQGDAAAGLAIDFYGRGQAQAIMQPGQTAEDARVGYADPAGAVYVDADPATILNGATDFELAQRFLRFCLSVEAQALWQLPATSTASGRGNPANPDVPAGDEPLGPVRYELRRMPITRELYEPRYFEHFVDRVNPYEIASETPSRGWRSAIAPMTAAFGIDTADELRGAWAAYHDALDAGVLSEEERAEIESLLFAMPVHRTRPGCLTAGELASLSKEAAGVVKNTHLHTVNDLAELVKIDARLAPGVAAEFRAVVDARPIGERDAVLELPFDEANSALIKFDTDSWKDPVHGRRSLIAYTEFFRENFRRAERLARKQ